VPDPANAEPKATADLRAAVERALATLGNGPAVTPDAPPGLLSTGSGEVQVLQQEGRLLFAVRRQREQLVREVAGLRAERETIRQEVEALVRLGLERRREAAEDVERLEHRSRELLTVVDALARQVLSTLDAAAQLSATLERRESAVVEPLTAPAPVDGADATPLIVTDAERAYPAERTGRVDGLLRWLGIRERGAGGSAAPEAPSVSA
jgi:hypothetical protein